VAEAWSFCLRNTLDNADAEKCLSSSPARAVEPSSLPKLAGDQNRIELVGLPPSGLVTVPVKRAMMAPARRIRR
jgi:hypothetical protein